MKAKIKGLYAITPDIADTPLLLRKTEAALAGGARILQYRNKTASAALRREQATRLRTLCDRYGVALIINDDIELARTVAAEGVHIGAEDGSIAAARAMLGPQIIGVSCYDEIERARQGVAYGADYVAFGSFFCSATKPLAVEAPLSLLATAREVFDMPIVAIGGITLANAALVLNAGANAIAVISALFDADDIQGIARQFCELCEEVAT